MSTYVPFPPTLLQAAVVPTYSLGQGTELLKSPAWLWSLRLPPLLELTACTTSFTTGAPEEGDLQTLGCQLLGHFGWQEG